MMPRIRPTIVYFTSSPIPSVMPTYIQCRGRRSRTTQRNQYMDTIHVTWSNVTVWNTQFVPSRYGAAMAVTSASPCMSTEPPSRRT